MPHDLYVPARTAILRGQLDWVTGDVRAILVDVQDYAVDLTNHQYLSSIPVAARVAVAALANKTVVGGACDADDTVWTAVSGDPSEAIVLYQHTGNDATAPLIAYLDQVTGLPITPNGGDITIQWSNQAARVLSIVAAV